MAALAQFPKPAIVRRTARSAHPHWWTALGVVLAFAALCGFARAEPAAETAHTPAAAKPRAAAKAARGARTLVTFIGYRRVSSDTDQVYVELTETANVETSRSGRTLRLSIANAKVTRRNNKNPLVAAEFDSIVESARLVQAGKKVELVIRLRAAAEPQSRVVPRSGGATLEVNLTRTNGTLPPDDAPKKHKRKKKSERQLDSARDQK